MLGVVEGCVLVKIENLSFLVEFCSVLIFSFCGELGMGSLFVGLWVCGVGLCTFDVRGVFR